MRADRKGCAGAWRIAGFVLLAGFGLVGASAQPPTRLDVPELVLADFDNPGWQNNLGLPFGAWNSDPDDSTQACRVRLVERPRVGSVGYSLQLDYDVDSPNPAFNGFWMKLPKIPLRNYEALHLLVKGDAQKGFSTRFKIELKGARHTAAYVLDGIDSEWTRMRIPLRGFRDIRNVKEAAEFVIVFDDDTVTRKVGTLYLDEVVLEAKL